MFPTSFPDKEVISTITAKMLIEVEAVRFSSGEPFKFTSGWASPVYIDCRKLISYVFMPRTYGLNSIRRTKLNWCGETTRD